jgi:chorismate mutase/prephenate dehydratase
MNIDDLRKQIDSVDANIVKLVAERIRAAEKIGALKREQGKEIVDSGREKLVLDHIKQLAVESNLNPEDLERIYRLIMAATKASQGLFVAFQGEAGAYSEDAALGYFGSDVTTVPCEGFDEVFAAVEKNDASYGIIPVENSLEGSISRSYDLLLESSLKVCGETELRIIHCLIGNNRATLDSIKKVYSHPQALGQCRSFLKRLNFQLISSYDTAGSVKMIKEMSKTDVAAIASARAADIYGMKIIVRGIEDNSNNYTRFFILAEHDTPPSGIDKTSIVFSVPHKPGYLYAFLDILAKEHINLTKIESRPTRLKPWEYNFYLDFEGHREDSRIKKVLASLEEKATFVKVLGSYPKGINK